jgi:arylsulfatase A-like enzyme
MTGYQGKFPEVPFAGKGSYGAQAEPKAAYAAMVSRLDRDIQRVIDLLKQKRILNNTLIIFISDNGAHKEGGNDPDFFDSNGPYRGYKRDLYEGGIRTPFIAYWPSVIQPGSKSSLVSAFWDFLPTVCDLINVPVPKDIDGISFLPTLNGKGIQNKHESLYFEFHEQGGKQAIIKDGWKLLHLNVNNPAKLQVELYHFSEDIAEQNNVAAKFPQKVEELTKLLKNQRTVSDLWNFTK